MERTMRPDTYTNLTRRTRRSALFRQGKVALTGEFVSDFPA